MNVTREARFTKSREVREPVVWKREVMESNKLREAVAEAVNDEEGNYYKTDKARLGRFRRDKKGAASAKWVCKHICESWQVPEMILINKPVLMRYMEIGWLHDKIGDEVMDMRV